MHQSSQAETTNDVISEYKPIVKLLRAEIKVALKAQGVQLGLAYAATGLKITQGEIKIRLQLEALDANVKQAEDIAATNNTDIQSCVDAVNADVAALDRDSMQNCRNVTDLENAGQKLSLLGILRKNSSRIIDGCQVENPSVAADLRTCIESEITSTRGQLVELVEGITSDIDAGKASTSDCVDSATSELGSGIEKISNDFESCVTAA